MILYVVEIYRYCDSEDWETVNIWKTRENAEKAVRQYKANWFKHSDNVPEYRIVDINTDIDSDCIYDVVTENNSEG